jgi:chemotaxis protein methyltransferase CheR
MATSNDDKRSVKLGYGDYLRFSRLVHDLYGLNFSEKRRSDLEHGLLHAFAGSACGDLDTYYQILLDPINGVVHKQRLVNALTIGESHFFRNSGQFDALYTHVLPEIIERRKSLRTLRIWSAGCAGGQEPYSIAMMLRDLLPDIDDWAVTILGTDINTAALDQAQQAVYSDWAFREARALRSRARYFRPVGKRYALCPEVRRMVTFAQLNLADGIYPSFQTNTTFMDLILCRNVTIYFSAAMTRSVIARFYDALVEGGWLAVGHSEHSVTTYQQFQVRNYANAILYQRTGESSMPVEDWGWLKPAPAPTQPSPSALAFSPAPVEVKPDAGLGAVDVVSAPLAQEAPDDDHPLERAKELLAYGHSEQARGLLMDFLGTAPDDPLGCSLLCQAYANLGNWSAAETWCQRAIDLDQLQQDPYYTLALVLQHQEHLEQALAAMKKVVYLDSQSVRGHYGLANLYYSLGHLPKALKSLDNAQRLIADQPEHSLLPGTGGLTVGHLRQAMMQQQQQWRAEVDIT